MTTLVTSQVNEGIAALTVRLQTILADMEANNDVNRHFLATYARTTVAVEEELKAGGFLDASWVEHWDIHFAELYLDALEAWRRGETTPIPWRVAFTAAEERRDLPPLRHVLLGMNAHINWDLPQALLGVISDEDFKDQDVLDRRAADHAHIDKVLLRRVGPEDQALSNTVGGKSLYEKIKGPLERRGTGKYLQEARSKVWANTRLLAATRGQGDTAEYERLLAELARRSAGKLDQLVGAREVVFQLWLRGFGVLLDGAKALP